MRAETRVTVLREIYGACSGAKGMSGKEYRYLHRKNEHKSELRKALFERGLITRVDGRYFAVKCWNYPIEKLRKNLIAIERSEADFQTIGPYLIQLCEGRLPASKITDDELEKGAHVVSTAELWRFFEGAAKGRWSHLNIVNLQPAILASIRHLKDHKEKVRLGELKAWAKDLVEARISAPKLGEEAVSALAILSEFRLPMEEWLELVKTVLTKHGKEIRPLQSQIYNVLTGFDKVVVKEYFIDCLHSRKKLLREGARFMVDLLP